MHTLISYKTWNVTFCSGKPLTLKANILSVAVLA